MIENGVITDKERSVNYGPDDFRLPRMKALEVKFLGCSVQFQSRFQDGRDNVEDDSRSGRRSTSKADENIEEVGNHVRSDRRLSIRAIAEFVRIDKEWMRQKAI
ncbi:hypothetical protein O3M35_010153 [Rhynocoris fuscipes]|uniref:Uncharacterized protein n=1 Tax=Rhynocoris fuscipes TaxID=488301 RepID=A0AAW1D0Q1_9HEMI